MRRSPLPPQDTPALLHHWREMLPGDRLAHLVRDVARMQTRALQLRLAAHGVAFGHWTFLRILWAQDGLTQRQLSLSAGVMEPTTYAAVRGLEELGLIERRQRPGNRKNVHVFLTPAGQALEPALVPLAEEVNAVSVAGLAAADIDTVRRALLAMVENLALDEAAGADEEPSSRVRKTEPKPP